MRPFLFAVQIIVYTGAILMLFLFVLMLVGVDAADSLVETIKGQRPLAVARRGRLRLRCWSSPSATRSSARRSGWPTANSAYGGNVQGIAALIFNRYVFAFEATSALLITAAVGAMVLAAPRAADQEEDPGRPGRWSGCRRYAETGRAPGPAAHPRRVRPAQRGGHPGPAARTAASRSARSRPRCGRAASMLDAATWSPDPRTRCIAGELPIAATRRGADRHDRSAEPPARPPTTRSGPDGGGPMNPTNYIVLSAILFTIGAIGFMVRRNAIVAFMCVELMLNAANLSLVTFSRMHGALDGQVAAFFVMVVAAAEVVVGLAIIVTIFRTRRSASVDDANLLKF